MDNTAQLDMQTMRHFNERQRRMYAGSLAKQYGWGGISRLHKETGLDPHTSRRGMQELEEEPLLESVRKGGGGRKKTEHHQPGVIDAIELEANPKTDKRTIVKWTSHSLPPIARALRQRGFQIATTAVRRILKDKGYALKANKKDVEGASHHPDRDKQFQHLNMMGLKMQAIKTSSGSIVCNNLPLPQDLLSMSATIRQAPRNGTLSNMPCFPLSASTGGPNH